MPRLLTYACGPEWLGPGGRIWTRDDDGLWTTFDRLDRKAAEQQDSAVENWLDKLPAEFLVIDADEFSDEHLALESAASGRIGAAERAKE